MENKEVRQYCNAVYNQNTINRQRAAPRFPKKGDLGIAKNYRGIILTSISAKLYNDLPLTHIEPKIEKVLWKK